MSSLVSKDSLTESFKGFSGVKLAILITLMAFIPISQGGMTPGAFAIWLIATGILSGLSVYGGLFKPDTINQNKPKSGLSWAVVWLIVTAVCLVHVVLKVSISEYWLSGFRGIKVLSPELNPPSNSLMSYARLQTLGTWAFFTAFWSIAYVSSRLKRTQVKWVLVVVLVMGAFEAIYGLVSMQGDGNILGLWQKIYYASDATGTFTNRNHFANFLALCLPLGLCALSGNKPWVMSRYPKNFRLFLLGLYVVISILAALASHSRMGLVVTLVAGFSWLIMSQLRNKRRLRIIDWLGLLGSVLLLVLIMLWFGVTETTARAVNLAEGNGRLEIWSSIFDLPNKVWISGIGPGNFSEVFALVKPIEANNFFYYAHNDYLEFVLEFGVPASILLIVIGLIWFRLNFKGSLLKDKLSIRTAAACALFVMVLHSLVDFSLQIPANATYAAMALGLLLNHELRDQIRRKNVKSG